MRHECEINVAFCLSRRLQDFTIDSCEAFECPSCIHLMLFMHLNLNIILKYVGGALKIEWWACKDQNRIL